jgi:WD40 repeat protein
VSHEYIPGSYDCTAKVWRRDNWVLIHNISLHTDSVWDIRVHGDVMATAGLDGTVGVFDIARETNDVTIRFLLQARTIGPKVPPSKLAPACYYDYVRNGTANHGQGAGNRLQSL